MAKLRKRFWTDSVEFLEWCTDDELKVLHIKVGKELEKRLKELTKAIKLPNVKAKRLRV